MYHETDMGKKPINPAHFVARYALKYVAHASSSHGPEGFLTYQTYRFQ